MTEYHPARETSLFTLPEEYVGTGSGEVPEGYPSDFDLDVWVEGDGSFTFDFDASADGLETTWGMSMFMVPEQDGLRGTFNAEVHTATLDSGYNTWDEGAILLTRSTP